MIWIDVNDQMPKHDTRVLVCYKNELEKDRVEIAEYIPPRTILAENYFNSEAEGCDEYDEEKDCWWVKEGWYEASWTADTNWALGYTPTHWMPLPQSVDMFDQQTKHPSPKEVTE